MASFPISINARQRNIIYTLLQADSHLTIEELSHKTSLSPRVIRYNLDVVKAWFKGQSIHLEKRPGYGIEIDASKQMRKDLLSIISGYDDQHIILTGSQRRRVLLLDMLDSSKFMSFQSLATLEEISRSTIIHDINEINDWLAQYDLKLIRKTKLGITIEGKELSRRSAILDIMRQELGEKKWISIWNSGNFKDFCDKSLPVNIENYISCLELSFCFGLIDKIEKYIGRKLTTNSRSELLFYIAIMIKSLKSGRPISEVDDHDCSNTVEYEVASLCMVEISRRFGISVFPQEVIILCAYLLSSTWVTGNYISADSTSGNFEEMLSYKYANAIVGTCSNLLHPLLKIDHELIGGLANHLMPVIYRLLFGLPIQNPLLPTIKNTYPEIFRSARAGMAIVEQDLKKVIPDGEIANITLYLAAALERLCTHQRVKRSVLLVTDGDLVKATLLSARLRYEFPSLDAVSVINDWGANPDVIEDIDLIISLIPIESKDVPVIQVSPFINSIDYKSIQMWLREKEEKERRAIISKAQKPGLTDLLEPSAIKFITGEFEWKDVVEIASQPLIKSGCIEDKYVKAMISIIEEYGPYMILAPGVILLHARPTDGVNSLCISLLILDKGTYFRNTNESIDVVFVLGAVDSESHLNALFQLNNLITNPDFMTRLRETGNSSEVLRAIWANVAVEAV